MALKVKVCGITSPEAAEMALAAGADFIGIIIFPKSPRCVAPEKVPQILEAVPEGKRVLVDVATASDVLDRYRRWKFDFFQMHFPLEVSMASLATWTGLIGRSRLWAAPKIPPDEKSFPQIVLEFADTIVSDTYHPAKFGGTGATGDWGKFQEWSTLYQHKNWVLAGGLNPQNAVEAVQSTAAEIIDLNSGVESAPGVKDPAKVKQLFENLKKSGLR
jgi:phosphoribosylanthranilate isomerase